MSQNPAPTSTLIYDPVPRPGLKIEAVGVVLPARNQSKTVEKCIMSIFAANSFSGWHTSLWIVVVADTCTDATARVARDAIGAFGQVLEVSARSPQMAHRIGASAVLEHFKYVPRHGLLITSADTSMNLNRDWIDSQLRCSNAPVGLR